MIVEVEAYIGESDPACHAAPGPTRRNQPLYGPAGHAYVYLNYGIHALVNVVTEADGFPAAVLLRALSPLEGVGVMRRRRGRQMKGRRTMDVAAFDDEQLCRGPGNLTMAMGITLRDNRLDLTNGHLFVEDRGITPPRIVWGPRIGIRVGTDRPWRCYAAGHPAVSSPNPRRTGAASGTYPIAST